jgi:predicted acyltransferase
MRRRHHAAPVAVASSVLVGGDGTRGGVSHAGFGEDPGMTAVVAAPRASGAVSPRATRRLLSLDIVRGAAVGAMLLVNNPGVRGATPAALRHSDWSGFSPADAIFPLFMFAIGMSMPLSRRAAEPRRALQRVVVLWFLGVGLVTLKYHYVGVGGGVLQHIAGAYLIAWLAMRLPARWQIAAAVGLLAGAWAALTFTPGAYGLFAGEGPAVVPASAVSILAGVFVSRSVLGRRVESVLRRLLVWATLSLAVGLLLAIPIPVVKHLWTPSYAVIAHGVACAVLFVVHWLVHRRGHRSWIRPFTDLGANPIAVYVVMSASAVLFFAPLQPGVVDPLSAAFGPGTASVLYAMSVAVLGWFLAAWMRRRELYVRI